MDIKLFTFWTGGMPEYIKMCLETWKVQFVILNRENLGQYTDMPLHLLDYKAPAHQSDIARIHVLRDSGGTWLDTDTIMIKAKFPDADFVGNPEKRYMSGSYIRAEKQSDMMVKWCEYQERATYTGNWTVFMNGFAEPYLQEHKEIPIDDIRKGWPETYMIKERVDRPTKYNRFYFEDNYHLDDIELPNMLWLHNSWTPDWYKMMSREQIESHQCTMSNLLKEARK